MDDGYQRIMNNKRKRRNTKVVLKERKTTDAGTVTSSRSFINPGTARETQAYMKKKRKKRNSRKQGDAAVGRKTKKGRKRK